MSFVINGYTLNQRQCDAIVPVMNQLMQGKVKQKNFEAKCIEALEAAGCALGYDTTMPGADKSITERAQAWIVNGRVGMSSRSIYCHMMGVENKRGWDYPLDPDDLNRCLLLLDLIPEWKVRMCEMSTRGKEWAGLAEKWAEISACFIDEVGLNWSHGDKAGRTYAMMKEAQNKWR
jgi:hypothetical protein